LNNIFEDKASLFIDELDDVVFICDGYIMVDLKQLFDIEHNVFSCEVFGFLFCQI
jgi:hypothetical protein